MDIQGWYSRSSGYNIWISSFPAGDVAAEFIKGYEGVIQTDGYKGYDFIDHIKEILHMGASTCVVNSLPSRKLRENLQMQPGKPLPAGIEIYPQTLWNWRQAKEKGLTGVELLRERHEKAATVMDDFKKLLDTSLNNVPPQAYLGKPLISTNRGIVLLSIWKLPM